MSRPKLRNTIQYSLLAAVVLLLLIVIASLCISAVAKKSAPSILGYTACFVVSGSMEPAISINDVIIAKEIESPKMNDIVLFQCDKNLVVHRVVDMTDNGKTIITRGDANNVNDEPINRKDVVGKVILIIPYLGYLITFLKSPYGILALLSVVFILYIITDSIIRLKKSGLSE